VDFDDRLRDEKSFLPRVGSQSELCDFLTVLLHR
jgi:hypothetical protein